MLKLLEAKYGYGMATALDAFRQMVWEQDNYTPTPAQAEYIFEDYMVKLVAGGVRAGKSKSSARSMDWFMGLEDGLIWIIGPRYNEANVEFDYMLRPYLEMGLLDGTPSTPLEGPRFFKVAGGAKVETKSATDPIRIASYAPDAILVVEAGQTPYEIVAKAEERAVQKDAYVIYSGTFEESLNWYADMFQELQTKDNKYRGKSYSLPTWSNVVEFPGGREDPKIKRLEAALPEDLFLERCAARPYKPVGLVFREFNPKRHVGKLDVDPSLPVELAIDPAYHTYAVLFVQQSGEYVHVLDEVYRHNAITQEIIPEVMDNPLFQYVKGGVIDQAARQKQANVPVWQVWHQETGLGFRTNYVHVQQGIDAVKLRMKDGEDGEPRLLFSNRMSWEKSPDGRAGGILTEMLMWRWPYSLRNDHKNTSRTPIDKNNDGCKALGYYLFDRFGPVVERAPAAKAIRRNYWKTAA
jgi:hypothetical protein